MGENIVSGAVATFIDIDPMAAIALIALGAFGGLLSGFIGSGGSFVLTPGMMNLGVNGSVAVASNMAHKFPKSLVGALMRAKLGHVDIKLGLFMAASAIAGVQVGIQIQRIVRAAWGKSGSDLYISTVFVIVLSIVGAFMLVDGSRAARMGVSDSRSAFAEKVKRINIPPMVYFKRAESKVSAWVIVPLGFATGLLGATIAAGGFIGVPSMIYVIGAPGFVASGTELVISFVMGSTATFTFALEGFVDLRLTVLILAGSLIGVQIGAIATSYVKQYMIKIVTGFVMILSGVSRATVIPTYLSDLHAISVSNAVNGTLNGASTLLLYGTMVAAGAIILTAMAKGKRRVAAEARMERPAMDAGVAPQASPSDVGPAKV